MKSLKGFSLYPWIAFICALLAYWLTVDPGPSYWDCPEYLVTALRLEVGHPPGNPAWTLTHRFVTSFFSDPAVQVRVVNMMSGLFTALGVMILCSVCVSLMRWIWIPERKGRRWRSVAIGVSAVAASLCFGWGDSAWYSAVEAEVYAMSLFLMALSIWMALRYAFSFSVAARGRWIVAIAYLMGISVGVHQLNLLAIPAIALIVAFRGAPRRKLGFMRGSLAFVAGCAVVGLILLVIMPWSLRIAGLADIYVVNSLGAPYWSGAALFWVLSLAAVVALALFASRRSRVLGLSFWSLAAVMTGFSVYILIPIRAAANPPMNEGAPSSVMRMADYLDRRQYGGSPLFRGRTPMSRVMRLEKVSVSETGDTVRDYSQNALRLLGRDYRPVASGAKLPARSRFLTDSDRALNSRLMADSAPHGYGVAGFRLEEITTPELDMWFPRIHSSAPGDLRAYGDWTGLDSASMAKVRISEAFDSLGNPVPLRDSLGNPVVREEYRPTYLQALTYFLGYQTGYMYLRYLMWNFSGRQNDVPSTGEIEHGNFLTGIPPVDESMLADQSLLPPELGRENAGRTLYCLPFLLGIVGILFLAFGKGDATKRRRVLWGSFMLFVMTGIAIVFYLNQTPGEPRERDYTFLENFWTFSIWIAFGFMAILLPGRRKGLLGVARKIFGVAVAAVVSISVLLQNYPSHDRSGRSATLDYASNLLESLPQDAILFVDGDNYIFPLWFAQEVAGIRRDVNVVCDAYLGSDWYIAQLMVPAPGNDGIRMVASEGDIAYGNCNLVRLPTADADTLDAVEALKSLYADSAPTPRFHARYLRMAAGKDDEWIFDILSIPGKGASSIATLREAALIDIIASNEASRYPRPVYWHDGMRKEKYRGFFPYTRQALYARRLMPSAPDSAVLTVESLDALPKIKSGGADGEMRYAGPDVSGMVSGQRAALLRLAGALQKEGRSDLALHVARMAMVRFPAQTAPYMYRRHADTLFREAPELARILSEAGSALGDSDAIADAKRILKAESLRNDAFRRYYESLPPSRRGAVSPVSRSRALIAE